MQAESIATLLLVSPFLGATIVTFVDFALDAQRRNYFERARDLAVKNLQEKRDCDVRSWHFDCFREALIRRDQTSFLFLLFIQCITSVLRQYIDGNGAFSPESAGSIHTLAGMAITLLVLTIMSAQSSQPFAWYYPRNGVRSYDITFGRAISGRLLFLVLVGAIVFFQPDLLDFSTTLLPDRFDGISEETLQHIVIWAVVILAGVYIALSVITVSRSRRNDKKDDED